MCQKKELVARPALCALLLMAAGCGKFQRLETPPEKTRPPLAAPEAARVPTIACPAGGTFGLVAVPAGVYRVGSVEGGLDAQPREVETGGFWISIAEVTEEQFGGARSRRPVANVTLGEARAFCRRLSESSGKAVRLPKADEWEIAARGGVRGARYPWGWGDPVGRAAFSADRSARVGAYPANGYGIHDMAGNVAEWCEDGTNAALCGGSWADRDGKLMQVFRRTRLEPNYRGDDIGFRILVEKE